MHLSWMLKKNNKLFCRKKKKKTFLCVWRCPIEKITKNSYTFLSVLNFKKILSWPQQWFFWLTSLIGKKLIFNGCCKKIIKHFAAKKV